MARAIWKGSISFGLVSVPVAVHPAVRERRPKFRLLHARDMSPIKYQRVCEREGKPVDWEDLVKGYEYAKGHFVVLRPEDFEAALVGRRHAIAIMDFVQRADIDERYFEKPYHLVPTGPGVRAYQVLREAMARTGLVAIASVVLRDTPHLTCVHPIGDTLELSLMRYADELVQPTELEIPPQEKLPANEIALAVRLIKELETKWDPERYTDEYRERIERAIAERIEKGKVHAEPIARQPPSNVIDLMERLQQSLAGASKTRGRKAATKPRARKAAASSSRAKKTGRRTRAA